MNRDRTLDMAVRAMAKQRHFSRKRLEIVASTAIVFPTELAIVRDYFERLSDLMAGDVPVHG